MIKRIIIIFCLLFSSISFASAVETDIAIQSAKWDNISTKVETSINSGSPSDGWLSSSREELVKVREEAQSIIDANASQITELKARISTILASVPEGSTASPEIDIKLDELRDDLAEVEVPSLTAELAYRRADDLIVEVDSVIRKNFSNTLTKRSVSPILPTTISSAAINMIDAKDILIIDTQNIFSTSSSRDIFFNKLPITIILVLLGFALLFYIPRQILNVIRSWSEFVPSKFGDAVLIIGRNLVELLCGLVGVFVIFSALQASGALGIYGGVVLSLMNKVAYAFVIGRWLAFLQIDEQSDANNFLQNWSITILAVIAALSWNIDQTATLFGLDENTLSFLNLIFVGSALFFVAPIASREKFTKLFSAMSMGGLMRIVSIGRSIYFYGAILTVILAIAGYYGASRQIFHGLNFTFLLALFCSSLFRVCFDIIRLFWDDSKTVGDNGQFEERAMLWPVLLGTGIWLASLPLLALIWGARSTDLNEIWVGINNGISIGDVRISAVNFVQILIVFAIGFFIVKGIKRLLQNLILPRSRLDIGGQTAIVSLFGYAGYTIAAFLALNAAGINLSSLAVVLGALSVGIGFGLQNIVSNFVSGIILLIERPIKKGDWISVSGHEGYVRKIAVRSTEIETFDHASVIVPNADLVSQSVLNWVHTNKIARVKTYVGVSYDSDPENVKKLLLEAVNELPIALRIPEPTVLFQNFGDSSLDFELRFCIREADGMATAKSDANFAIFRKFKAHDISIPFPQREILIKSNQEN